MAFCVVKVFEIAVVSNRPHDGHDLLRNPPPLTFLPGTVSAIQLGHRQTRPAFDISAPLPRQHHTQATPAAQILGMASHELLPRLGRFCQLPLSLQTSSFPGRIGAVMSSDFIVPLPSVLRLIQRRMHSGCRMNTRKKHPNSAQLLARGEVEWPLSWCE